MQHDAELRSLLCLAEKGADADAMAIAAKRERDQSWLARIVPLVLDLGKPWLGLLGGEKEFHELAGQVR